LQVCYNGGQYLEKGTIFERRSGMAGPSDTPKNEVHCRGKLKTGKKRGNPFKSALLFAIAVRSADFFYF